MHAHTDHSDGRLPPPAVADWYARRGYDFLAITDHGRFTRVRPPVDRLLMVPGAEITARDERSGSLYHLVALFEEDDGGLVSSIDVVSPQAAIDALVGAGAVVIVAHPYWLGLTSAETGALSGPLGIEVYNHHCELGRGRGYSEQQWDELLLAGRRLLGFAADDCHFRTMDAGGGWVMLRAGDLSPASVLAALRRGDFYSTQGPEITRFEIVSGAGGDGAVGQETRECETAAGGAAAGGCAGDLVAVVECSPCRQVAFYADRWLGAVVSPGVEGAPDATLLTAASYRPSAKETYIRAVCVDAAGRKAWTNPLFLERGR